MATSKQPKKLWGGRFAKDTDSLVERFTESISFDHRLIAHDIRGSIAHARMLGKCGIIARDEAQEIVEGLDNILEEWNEGKVALDESAEDIHMNVEKLLYEKIGETAGKLHTARSRNDQVATDIRLFLKAEIQKTVKQILACQKAIVAKAEKNAQTIMPGYTHLQHAQPVLLGHHLMSWFWMLERDKERFADCYKRVDELPLGSGALAGTTFRIDRQYVASKLGFSRVSQNSMDSVADRDLISEAVSACAICMTHLSRYCEEIILWSTSEFDFIKLDDSVTTGSSIMPQKKNPDVAELIRGKSARVIGAVTTLMTLQKGLPLAYNRDLQEDKEPLFDAVDTTQDSLALFALMLKTARFNKRSMYKAASEAFSTATDLADYLVRHGVPFRRAHAEVGGLVAYCIENGKDLDELTLDEIREYAPEAESDVQDFLTVESCVNERSARGGTSPGEVKRQIVEAKAVLKSKILS